MMGKGSVPSESSPKYLFLCGEAAFRFPLHNTHTQKNERPHDNSDKAFFVVPFLSIVCVCVSKTAFVCFVINVYFVYMCVCFCVLQRQVGVRVAEGQESLEGKLKSGVLLFILQF